MNTLKNYYSTFCVTFGMYGIHRNLRADSEEPLSIRKLNHSLANGFTYGFPITQIVPTYKLIKRLEIENYFKQKYKSTHELDTLKINNRVFYKEVSGFCFDTI